MGSGARRHSSLEYAEEHECMLAQARTLYDDGLMGASVVTLKLKLEAATKQEDNHWVAWCVPLDVYSQGDTREAALSSLREAVNLWFESCIQRDVLPQALEEAGFRKSRSGEPIPKDVSIVEMQLTPAAAEHNEDAYAPEVIEVDIPAYTAAQQLSGLCAAR